MPQRWTVRALDPTGEAKQTIATDVAAFRLQPSYRTVWYLLER